MLHRKGYVQLTVFPPDQNRFRNNTSLVHINKQKMALWKPGIKQMPLQGLKLDLRGQYLPCRYKT